MNLLELATRVEGASGPDRELDGEIAKLLAPDRDWHRFENGWGARCLDDGAAFDMAPAYTASIEVARSLVPIGVFEEIWSGTGAKRSSAQLIYPKPAVGHRRHSIYVVAASEPLALCAAALRARAHPQQPGKE